VAQGYPDVQSDRRGPPTDRPPDDPPPCKGASRGSLQERAGFRHASQLSSGRGNNGLSGNAALSEKIQNKVQTSSNQRYASEAGSSQDRSRTRRVRSWRHTSGRRFRAKGYACGNLSPSRNLGRNLSPRGVFLQSTESASSMAEWERLASCSHPIAGPSAVVR
jgi:hypothetical protein